MILTARHDIDAPIDAVFARLTDVTAHERAILRRGAELRRSKGSGGVSEGSEWKIKFRYRGKDRKATARITQINAPHVIDAETEMGGLTLFSTVELMQMSRGTTRLAVRTKLKPNTLSARLVVQSMKLTRGSIERKFADRIEDFGKSLEDRVQRTG